MRRDGGQAKADERSGRLDREVEEVALAAELANNHRSTRRRYPPLHRDFECGGRRRRRGMPRLRWRRRRGSLRLRHPAETELLGARNDWLTAADTRGTTGAVRDPGTDPGWHLRKAAPSQSGIGGHHRRLGATVSDELGEVGMRAVMMAADIPDPVRAPEVAVAAADKVWDAKMALVDVLAGQIPHQDFRTLLAAIVVADAGGRRIASPPPSTSSLQLRLFYWGLWLPLISIQVQLSAFGNRSEGRLIRQLVAGNRLHGFRLLRLALDG